jgi:flagellar FliL protein
MEEPDQSPQDKAERRSKLPLIAGLVLMLAMGGGGFFAVYKGLVLGAHSTDELVADVPVQALPDIAFVPIDPIVVSLGTRSSGRFLHFNAQLEVAKANQADVTLLLPRILDVLNGYLRAVDVKELEEPTALVRLRAQMLRRVQIVAGEGRIRDLLVSEFVIN